MEVLTEFFSSPLGVLFAGVAAFLIGMLFFDVKQWEARWKQDALDASNAMSKAGLVHTPKILSALAVGNLAGAFTEIKNIAGIFHDPAQLKAEFQTLFANVLNAQLADPVQAKALQALANDAVAAFASGDPAAAAAKLAADAQALAAANPAFAQVAANGLALPSLIPNATNPFAALLALLKGQSPGQSIPFAATAAGSSPAQPAPPNQTAQVSLPPGHTATVVNTGTAGGS